MGKVVTSREILIYLSVICNGDWQNIYDIIVNRISDYSFDDVRKINDSLKCKTVTILDDEYPQALKHIYRPPFVLFYYGNLSLISDYKRCLSIIGSRKIVSYTERHIKKIIQDLQGKYVIISGMALGTDACAHEAAISNNTPTVAILGSGIDCCYPKSNSLIYQDIKEKYLLMSEYPGNTPPKNENFPFRNRIISGLSWGVLLGQGQEKSGSMITISHSLSSNREVMVLPFPIGSGQYNNRLIKEGATLVENATDIIEEEP